MNRNLHHVIDKDNIIDIILSFVLLTILIIGIPIFMITGVQMHNNAYANALNYPIAIRQFKDDVKICNINRCLELYESDLEHKKIQEQQLIEYQRHHDINNTDFKQIKADYTATVCRLQILSEKLQSQNDKKVSNDKMTYKYHFDSNFIINSIVNKSGIKLSNGL